MASESMSISNRLPSWVTFWFYFTAVVCTWDASFIVFRPHTLPGGSWSQFWYPYKYYVYLDKRYMDISDAFVFAQSLLNGAEVVMNIVTLFMHHRRSRHTLTMAFMVTVMTFWKTVLYFLMFSEFCGDGHYREGNSSVAEFFLVCVPNGIWLVAPFAVIAKLWNGLTPQSQIQGQRKSKSSDNSHYTVEEKLVNGDQKNGHAIANANGVSRRKKLKA